MQELKWLFQLRTLPQAAIAVAACTAASGALAQTGSAANGEVLYRTDVVISNTPYACRDCHDAASLGQQLRNQNLDEAGIAARIGAAIGANRGGMSVYSGWTAQQRTDVAAYLLAAASAPPPPPFAPPPPPPTPPATPNPVMFNSTAIGTTSAASGILITNSSGATISFASPAITPVEGATTEFLPSLPPSGTTLCGTTLGPGMSCSFGAQFRPSTPGARSTVWIIKFSNGVVSRAVTLEGMATGTAAAPTPAPAPAPAPSPSPSPAPAPPPASAANAPTSGGGGALGWESILALAALPAAIRRRRRAE